MCEIACTLDGSRVTTDRVAGAVAMSAQTRLGKHCPTPGRVQHPYQFGGFHVQWGNCYQE